MGIMVYSLLWVMQDLYHQPYCTIVDELQASRALWLEDQSLNCLGCGYTRSEPSL